MIAVEKVFVFEQSGVPRVMFDFTEHQLIMDEILLSGFLSAIDGFSETLFRNPSSHFVINHGNRKITLFRGLGLVIAVISSDDLLYLKPKVDELLFFFSEKYHTGAFEVKDPEIYEDFKIKLVRVLFFLPICDDWIPIPRTDHLKFFEIKLKHSKLDEIDGFTPLNKLSFFQSNNPEATYELINYLYHEKAISFTNHIEARDYIRGEQVLISAIEGNQALFAHLKTAFPTIDIVKLIKELKKIRSVNYLEQCFGQKIIPVLYSLFDDDFIIVLDENRRKIAIIQKVVEDLLQIILQIEKRKKLEKNLTKILKHMEHPEILAQIDIEGEHFVSMQNHLPSAWETGEITRIKNLWINFAQKLIDFYYPLYKEKLNSAFFIHLIENLIPSLHAQDLEVVDPILHEIEGQCLDM